MHTKSRKPWNLMVKSAIIFVYYCGMYALLVILFLNTQSATQPLQKQWDRLLQRGGCLVGSQLHSERKQHNSVFEMRKEWQVFFKTERGALNEFLLNKLGSSDTTRIHTCPFENAIEGELAVYCLQYIHQTNWYDLHKSYSQYNPSNQDISASNNSQLWLRKTLETPKQRKFLKKNWQILMHNKRK